MLFCFSIVFIFLFCVLRLPTAFYNNLQKRTRVLERSVWHDIFNGRTWCIASQQVRHVVKCIFTCDRECTQLIVYSLQQLRDVLVRVRLQDSQHGCHSQWRTGCEVRSKRGRHIVFLLLCKSVADVKMTRQCRWNDIFQYIFIYLFIHIYSRNHWHQRSVSYIWVFL